MRNHNSTAFVFPAAFCLSFILTFPAAPGLASEQEQKKPQGSELKKSFGDFTSEILPVFYVTNSLKSVEFYQLLGFEFNHFHDYDTGESVKEWKKDTMPIYAQMSSGDQKFAIHLIRETDTLKVDGMRHYFGVKDVDKHYKTVKENGTEVSQMYDRPWMRMFYVTDPDGHVIFFFTRPETIE
jgi:uncharacterized glyoxalase superfamily protein PhnB